MPAKAEAQITRVNARATRVREVKRGIGVSFHGIEVVRFWIPLPAVF
jgi:hypothetical protein